MVVVWFGIKVVVALLGMNVVVLLGMKVVLLGMKVVLLGMKVVVVLLGMKVVAFWLWAITGASRSKTLMDLMVAKFCI